MKVKEKQRKTVSSDVLHRQALGDRVMGRSLLVPVSPDKIIWLFSATPGGGVSSVPLWFSMCADHTVKVQ